MCWRRAQSSRTCLPRHDVRCLATGRGCERQRIAALPVDRNMRRLISCFAVAACLASITSAAATPAAFVEVDRVARTAFARQRISGMGLSIYDARGNKVFEQMYGDFSPDRRIPIASAWKLVAGLTILRLVDQGKLSLDSSTG